MIEKEVVTEEEKKEVLGILYDKFKDTVDWNEYLFKKKMRQGLDKSEEQDE